MRGRGTGTFKGRVRACVLTISIGGLVAACGSAGPSTTPSRRTTTRVSALTASPSRVPNPFRIVARYSASSLGLKNARDLAIGPNGNLYITDATDQVTEVSPGGKVLRRWGGRGKRRGDFRFVSEDTRDPTDLAASITVAPTGNVYVSDSGNARVEVFSPSGRFIRQFGSSITNVNGHFLLPHHLVVDQNGDVYVVDEQQNVVEKYSPSGAFVWQVGSGAGSSDPDLSGSLSLASIDHHGLIPVSSDSGAIMYFDSQGHKVDSFRTTAYLPRGVGPCDVSLNAEGDAFVQSCPGLASVGEPASPPDQYALVFDHSHNLIGAWQHAPFASAHSPRFGPRGEVFALGYCRRVPTGIGCTPSAILKLKGTLR